MLPGCTEQEQEYNKYTDVEFLFNCYGLDTFEKRCACLDGQVLKLKVSYGWDKICTLPNNIDYIDIRDDPQINNVR